MSVSIQPPRRPKGSASSIGTRIATHVGIVAGGAFALLLGYVTVVAVTGNFHTVSDGQVYRSAQPSAHSLARYHRKFGIQTVINLRGENESESWYRDEIETSERLGIRHINFRMSAKRGITKKEAWRLIGIMQRAPKPLLIHCESGADRSGLASALYVAAVERLGEQAAEDQLSLRYGHIAAPFGKGWGMTVTFEEMEPSLGYSDS
tara:strand:+ start:27385 stop:28002 length:618 start_codon:yes stop_codon:yes gene_type:complete